MRLVLALNVPRKFNMTVEYISWPVLSRILRFCLFILHRKNEMLILFVLCKLN